MDNKKCAFQGSGGGGGHFSYHLFPEKENSRKWDTIGFDTPDTVAVTEQNKTKETNRNKNKCSIFVFAMQLGSA